jgi:hypothetical protein
MNEYYFPLIHGGLGDKFCMLSVILKHRSLYENKSILYLVTNNKKETFTPIHGLNSLIDFFHFEQPSFDIDVEIISKEYSLNDLWEHNMNNQNFGDLNIDLLEDGDYWPIKVKRNEHDKFTWMLYDCDVLPSEKCVTNIDMNKFYALCNVLSIKGQKLEDMNFSKNVELLSESKFLLSSEGMWTHLSRAMKVPTIAYTTIPEWNREINQQGHFCSSNFEECLFEVMEKAEI